MSKFSQALYFIRHWLHAVDAHSLHAPFLYRLYTSCIKHDTPQKQCDSIEHLRRQLLENTAFIPVEDLGAGSQHPGGSHRRIKDIARASLAPAHLSRLYCRLAEYLQCTTLVELGTSLGINTLYLGTCKNATVYTFEGRSSIATTARHCFQKAGARNIQLIEGNIDNTLPSFLNNDLQIDFALMDANHRHAPTLDYFSQMLSRFHDKSVVVVDDINYRREMNRAWKDMIAFPQVTLSIDMFRTGILFFDPSLNKQHVVLQY